MKKLQDNLAARIAASVILTVSFLLTLLSTAGIVLLASYQAYNDGGAQLRTSLSACGRSPGILRPCRTGAGRTCP